MNSILIRKVAYVASGALFGALGAYFVTNKVISEKYEEEIAEIEQTSRIYRKERDEAIANVDHIRDVCRGIGFDFDKAVEVYESNKNKVEEKKKDILESVKETAIGEKMYVDYTKAMKEYKPEDDVDNDEIAAPVEELKREADVEEPYAISVDDFSDTHEEYRKVTCTFYTDDLVICETSHNEKIDIKHVGKNNIAEFLNAEYDLLYIRNDYLGIDYEIDKYEGSYAYEVLGEEQLEE